MANGTAEVNLRVMSSPYSPSTVLFAENLNTNFNILSNLLYGIIDAFSKIYGTGGEANKTISDTTTREGILPIIETCFKDLFYRNEKNVRIEFNNETTDPEHLNSSIKLLVDTNSKSSSIVLSEDSVITSNKTEVKSVVNTNSYVDITTNNVTVQSVQNIDLKLASSGPFVKITKTIGGDYIELNTSSNNYIKLANASNIELKCGDANFYLILDKTSNQFIVSTASGKTMTLNNSANLILAGTDVNVSGGRLIHSPATGSGKTRVNSIWYDGTSTLYFD